MSRAPAAVRRPNETAAPASTSTGASSSAIGRYLEQSALPLTSLVFLSPFILFYELGTRWYASDPVTHVEQRIIAFSLMQKFFALFGATGQYMPPAAVVAILIAWHLARNDGWTTHIGHLFAMVVESAVYALPLLAMGYLFQHYLPLYTRSGNWRALLVLSVGAGVYEELVFRLVAFTFLSFLFIDVFKMPRIRALVLMILISAVAFSAYHYLGAERFEMRTFAFRTLAGIYFGMIFAWRGFGITACAHASYDIAVVLLQFFPPG